MSNLAKRLLESASAVAALGDAESDIAALDDASVLAGMTLVRDHRRNLQSYELLLSAEISRRSSHDLGNSGLARRNGSPTPATLIQSITGVSIDEANKLARLGSAVLEAESATRPDRDNGETTSLAAPPPLATAALSGQVSVDSADAIRKGLGRPDDAITIAQLQNAEGELLAQAGKVSPEALLKLARIARNQLDEAAVAEGQKRRSDLRYVRRWRRDGMSGGSWCLPDEDGGAEIDTALRLALASRTGGPRFATTDKKGNPVPKTAREVPAADPRTMDQVLADTFAQIVHNGLHVDPSVVPGAGRAPVRVMVQVSDLGADQEGEARDRVSSAHEGGSVARLALLEDSLSAVTFSKLEEYLCAGGQVGVLFDSQGQVLDVGREQRLFTRRQRTGLGVRDGGCRYPGCDKPPSWCEAHHINQWARDSGRTDICDGILLCKYHHMLIHDTESRIIRRDGTYWLRPGPTLDPRRRLIEMPSRNPLVERIRAG
jgi:hypothetical protein